LDTTESTFTPASFNDGTYFPGLPAPVVTTGTFSSMTTRITSAAKGDSRYTLIPNGLEVSALTLCISFLTLSGSASPAAITPKAPASLTAAASSAVATKAIPPCIMGYSIPNKSHRTVLIPNQHHPCQIYTLQNM